jgi:hypothetical protein
MPEHVGKVLRLSQFTKRFDSRDSQDSAAFHRVPAALERTVRAGREAGEAATGLLAKITACL